MNKSTNLRIFALLRARRKKQKNGMKIAPRQRGKMEEKNETQKHETKTAAKLRCSESNRYGTEDLPCCRANNADILRFVTLLNARRVLRDAEPERHRVSLN
jgi:hypothetical protein